MTKNKQEIMCEECFALIEECDCDLPEEDDFTDGKNHKFKGKWKPNIKKNEKWENVPSQYKAYKE